MSSPSTEPLKLVYLLTDRQGIPYKETSVDKLLLPAQSDVAGFRDAIKTKNSNKLSSVDASDLKVFKNKAAFDAGQVPLSPLSLLDSTFGTNEENALIVVVPSASSGMVPDVGTLSVTSPFLTPDILAKLTEFVQFAASFDGPPKAETVFTIPSFEDIFGGLLGNTPYFSAYEDLFLTIMELYNKKKETYRPMFLVLGTPGIGKSVFGIYCVLRLLQFKKNIAYRGLKSDFFIYFTARSDGTYEYSTSLNTEVMVHSYFKLFDGAERTGDFSPFPREEASFLFASPTDRNFNEFKKHCCLTFCLEPWSFKELNIFSYHTGRNIDWTEKYSIVGGVPRHIFSDDKPEYLRTKIEHTIPSHRQRLEDSIKNAIEFRIDTAIGNLRSPHILLHFWQAESSGTQYLQFATPDIEKMIMAAFQIQTVNELKRLLLTSDPELQSWRGKRFEDLTLTALIKQSNKTKSCSSLEPEGSPKHKKKLFHFTFERSYVIQAIEEVRTAGLYFPLSKSFPVLDALLINAKDKTIIYIQCTVFSQHPVKHEALKGIFDVLDKRFPGYSHSLVFFIPRDIFYLFKKQSYLNNDKKEYRSSPLRIHQYKYLSNLGDTLVDPIQSVTQIAGKGKRKKT